MKFAIVNNRQTLTVVSFFILYLILGVSVHSHYGVPWDEPGQRYIGLINAKYVAERFFPSLLNADVKKVPDLHGWKDKDYGAAFELPVVVLEQWMKLKDTKEIYSFRHLATFLFSFLGIVAIYATSKKNYGDYRFGLLAAAMIIFTPRFFAESFYNTKDIVFMASIAIAIYTMTIFLSKPTLVMAVIHGFFSALAIDIRLMGVVIVVCTLGALTIRSMKREVTIRKGLVPAVIYIISGCVFIILMFPFLWADPVGNFLLAFKNMAHFRWDNPVLYMGEFHRSTRLPWHYLPVWMLISIPPLFSVLACIGIVETIRQIYRNQFTLWSTEAQMNDVIYLALLVGPVVAVIVFSSVLYDGWRHLYFVYPAFILMSVKGVATVLSFFNEKSILKYALTGLLFMTFSFNAYWMWSAHPVQNVYFNSFIGHDWKNKFELDYWGVANREALQFILDNDPNSFITIRADSVTPLAVSLLIMNREDRKRIVLSKNEKPFYLLTNYRLVQDRDDSKYLKDYSLYYQKRVDGEPILSVFKINNPDEASR